MWFFIFIGLFQRHCASSRFHTTGAFCSGKLLADFTHILYDHLRALGQSYDWPSEGDATPKDTGNLIRWILGERYHHPNNTIYRQVSNISRTLVANKIVDHSDAFGASPVGAAPTTSSFSTEHLASMDWSKATARWDGNHLSFDIWRAIYLY